MAKSLRALTLNVRGLHDSIKRRKIFEWICDQKANVIFLQETFCTENLKPYLKASWKGGIHHSTTNSNHSKGVSILFSENLQYELINECTSIDGRKLLVNVKMLDTVYSFICIYAPNCIKERCEFFKSLQKWIHNHALNIDNIIMCGDMNCCLGDKDRNPPNHKKDLSRTAMTKLIKYINLDDMWSKMNKTDFGFTYNDKYHGTKSRLDYVLVSKEFSLTKKQICVMNAIDRDHKAVVADFDILENKRGKGYWKLNNSLLNDEEYVEGISVVLKETHNEYGDLNSKRLIWEIFKIKVKEFSIKYSVNQYKNNTENIKITQEKLDKLTKNLEKKEPSPEEIMQKTQYELEINEYYEKRAKGYQIRARAKWIQEGEKGTHYFLSLENQRQSSNIIKQLLSENEEIN